MKRIIFVGMCHKPDKPALCPTTKTGKLINRIIAKLPSSTQIEKTNLYSTDYLPMKSDEQIELQEEWFWTTLPTYDDVIVLLGQRTQLDFVRMNNNHNLRPLRVAHPASKRSHVDMDKYVNDVSMKILKRM